MTTRRWQRFAWLLPLFFSACGADPPKAEAPPPLPTRIQLQFIASPDINPDPSGRPSPVVLRVYELKGTDGFGKADFFKLFDQESVALAGDLIAKQEMLMRPGETMHIERTPETDIRFLGFAAAFRDNAASSWRTSVAIPPHQTTSFKVKLERLSVKVESVSN